MSFDYNTLYYGDCLDWMKRWDDECVDLIYLDPPFKSDTNYNMLYSTDGGGDAQYRAFADTWTWDEAAADRFGMFEGAVGRKSHAAIVGLHKVLGYSGMLAYLTYMAERLEEIHRLLKKSGSVFLHCDDTAVHYLKILMDCIFGPQQYLNNIVWKRATSHNDGKRFGRITDHILFYSKSHSTRQRFWDGYSIAVSKTEEELAESYPSIDERGKRYRSENITGAGATQHGESGLPWRGYDVSSRGRHWAPPRNSQYAQYIEKNFIPGYLNIQSVHERLEALDSAKLIQHPKRGFWPGLKRYAETDRGAPAQNLIIEPIGFTNFSSNRGEYLGYQTQKPVDLLTKLIRVACPPDGIVLDPFCGCGTTIEAARKLGKRWVGIDISSFAIDLIKNTRLHEPDIPTKGIPYDLASAKMLARDNPFNFESWAITRLPGFVPNTKQIGDGGIDGRATLAKQPDDYQSRLGLAQVKGGSNFSLSGLRDFIHVSNRDNAAIGCYITLEPVNSSDARMEVANLGNITVSGYKYRRMNLWPVSDFFDNKLPELPLMNNPYTGKSLDPGFRFDVMRW